MTTGEVAIRELVVLREDVTRARNVVDLRMDALRVVGAKVLEAGYAFARVGHPDHEHVGGSPFWVMGSLAALRELPGDTGPMGMGLAQSLYFTWCDREIEPTHGDIGQECYVAFWAKERAIREWLETQAAFVAGWEARLGPLPQGGR